MVRPVREVATAIEEQDIKSLSGLPGIGPATAERIVAKLRRKVPKFALLLAERDETRSAIVAPDVVSEGFSVLVSLGHSEKEARRLIDTALEKNENTPMSRRCSKRSTSRVAARKVPQANRSVRQVAAL